MEWNHDEHDEVRHAPTPDQPAGEGESAPIAGEGRDVLAILSEVESQLEAVRRLKDEQGREIERFEARREELSRRESEIGERERELQAVGARLEEQESGIAQRQREIESRERSISDREQSIAGRESEVESRENSLADRERRVQELEPALEERRAAVEKQEAELGDRQRALEEAEAKVRDIEQRYAGREQELSRREAEVEQKAANIEEEGRQSARRLHQAESLKRQAEQVQRQTQERMADLETELEEARTRLKEADARIEELRAGAESAGDTSAMEAEIARRDEALEEMRKRLKKSESERAALAEALESARTEASRGAPPEEIARRDEAISELKTRLKKAKVMYDRVNEELARAKAAGGSTRSNEFNARRRQRLRRQKELLAEQGRKLAQARQSLARKQQQCEQVLELKSQLSKEHAALAATKQKIEKKAAKSKAGVFMLCIVASLAIIAGLSWEVAGRIQPGVYLATSTLEIERSGSTPTAAQASAWQSYHEKLLDDPQLIERAAERMKKRGIAELGNPTDLRERLESDLDVSSGKDGRLTLTLSGEGASRTERVLQTLVGAITDFANDTRSLRADGRATIVSQRAEADDAPIEDRRLELFGMIAGSGAALLLLGTLVSWRMMTRRLNRLGVQASDVDAEGADSWIDIPSAHDSPRPI